MPVLFLQKMPPESNEDAIMLKLHYNDHDAGSEREFHSAIMSNKMAELVIKNVENLRFANMRKRKLVL